MTEFNDGSHPVDGFFDKETAARIASQPAPQQMGDTGEYGPADAGYTPPNYGQPQQVNFGAFAPPFMFGNQAPAQQPQPDLAQELRVGFQGIAQTLDQHQQDLADRYADTRLARGGHARGIIAGLAIVVVVFGGGAAAWYLANGRKAPAAAATEPSFSPSPFPSVQRAVPSPSRHPHASKSASPSGSPDASPSKSPSPTDISSPASYKKFVLRDVDTSKIANIDVSMPTPLTETVQFHTDPKLGDINRYSFQYGANADFAADASGKGASLVIGKIPAADFKEVPNTNGTDLTTYTLDPSAVQLLLGDSTIAMGVTANVNPQTKVPFWLHDLCQHDKTPHKDYCTAEQDFNNPQDQAAVSPIVNVVKNQLAAQQRTQAHPDTDFTHAMTEQLLKILDDPNSEYAADIRKAVTDYVNRALQAEAVAEGANPNIAVSLTGPLDSLAKAYLANKANAVPSTANFVLDPTLLDTSKNTNISVTSLVPDVSKVVPNLPPLSPTGSSTPSAAQATPQPSASTSNSQ